MIWDEVTSALDNETEKTVMEFIDSLQGHRTMISIVHSLSTIAGCDEFYENMVKKAIENVKVEVLNRR